MEIGGGVDKDPQSKSRLQAERKGRLNKAVNIWDLMKDLMSKGDKTMVHNALNELSVVCDDEKSVHSQLLCLMSRDEQEKHEIWFKAKFLSLNECIHDAERWVSNFEGITQENVGVTNNDGIANENEVVGIKLINIQTIEKIHMELGLLWMTLAPMIAFLMWEANA